MANPPLIFSRPGALIIECCSTSPSWEQLLLISPVDLTVCSALDPHTSTSGLASLSTVFTRSLLSGRFL